jgi:hypothetical protein
MFAALGLVRGIAAALGAALLVLAWTGCAHHHYQPYASQGYKADPRMRAPVHGYGRSGHPGSFLVFDATVNAYTLLGRPHHYFHHGHYYRDRHGRWERAGRLHGPWGKVRISALPPGLRKHHERRYADRHHTVIREHRHERERAGPRRQVRRRHSAH